MTMLLLTDISLLKLNLISTLVYKKTRVYFKEKYVLNGWLYCLQMINNVQNNKHIVHFHIVCMY